MAVSSNGVLVLLFFISYLSVFNDPRSCNIDDHRVQVIVGLSNKSDHLPFWVLNLLNRNRSSVENELIPGGTFLLLFR